MTEKRQNLGVAENSVVIYIETIILQINIQVVSQAPFKPFSNPLSFSQCSHTILYLISDY